MALWRIVSNGTPQGTYVEDIETTMRMPGVQAIQVAPIVPGRPVTAQVTIMIESLDVKADVAVQKVEKPAPTKAKPARKRMRKATNAATRSAKNTG